MTLNTLNHSFFFPRGDEQLSSGILQVTRGTTLLLDETVMEEGTLVDKGKLPAFPAKKVNRLEYRIIVPNPSTSSIGIKNLKAVSDISLYQTLSYVFPFNNLDFQTDISLLIVSLGNSLVPVSRVPPTVYDMFSFGGKKSSVCVDRCSYHLNLG